MAAASMIAMVGIAGPLLAGFEPGPNATTILVWIVIVLGANSLGAVGVKAWETIAAIKSR